jgi:hypothetical protein
VASRKGPSESSRYGRGGGAVWGCEKGVATMEGEELPLAARKGQKLGEGKGLLEAFLSCQRVAEVREGE